MAEALRRAIRQSGETVAAVSRGSGIVQPVLHRFVTGERDLTLRTADRLAAYFGLELRPGNGGRPSLTGPEEAGERAAPGGRQDPKECERKKGRGKK
jgi:hypothetical protein